MRTHNSYLLRCWISDVVQKNMGEGGASRVKCERSKITRL